MEFDIGSGLLVVLELNPNFPQDAWEEEVVEDLEYHGGVGFLVSLGGGRGSSPGIFWEQQAVPEEVFKGLLVTDLDPDGLAARWNAAQQRHGPRLGEQPRPGDRIVKVSGHGTFL